MKKTFVIWVLAATLSACVLVDDKPQDGEVLKSSDTSAALSAPADSMAVDSSLIIQDSIPRDTVLKAFQKGKAIDTKNVSPLEVVSFSKTLIGVPYRYASSDPAVGFDCSGFITYVFNHFGITVPRSSIDFTDTGTEVSMGEARPGDLVLFTGTDSTERFVGHMGLVVDNSEAGLNFIHSTSGKKHGVTITPLSDYYKSRYVKTIRIFP